MGMLRLRCLRWDGCTGTLQVAATDQATAAVDKTSAVGAAVAVALVLHRLGPLNSSGYGRDDAAAAIRHNQ